VICCSISGPSSGGIGIASKRIFMWPEDGSKELKYVAKKSLIKRNRCYI
jgi:hypothetical protein